MTTSAHDRPVSVPFKWLNQVKTILVTTGYSNLWEMQDQYNTKYRIAKNIPTAIKESIVSVCHDKIQTGSRCNSYKILNKISTLNIT